MVTKKKRGGRRCSSSKSISRLDRVRRTVSVLSTRTGKHGITGENKRKFGKFVSPLELSFPRLSFSPQLALLGSPLVNMSQLIGLHLCSVCENRTTKVCSNCKEMYFCSQSCQKLVRFLSSACYGIQVAQKSFCMYRSGPLTSSSVGNLIDRLSRSLLSRRKNEQTWIFSIGVGGDSIIPVRDASRHLKQR